MRRKTDAPCGAIVNGGRSGEPTLAGALPPPRGSLRPQAEHLPSFLPDRLLRDRFAEVREQLLKPQDMHLFATY